MHIRRARSQDLTDFLVLRKASILELASTHYEQDQLADWVDNINTEKLSKLFSDQVFFIGKTDTDIMTCGGFWAGHEVIHFYVSPEFNRSGWGSMLLAHIEEDYRQGSGNDYIIAEAANNARSFYEANGYRFMSLERGADGRIPYTYSVMRKDFTVP